MRVLLIDDLRSFPEATFTARNFIEGLHQLRANGPWDLLMLDHDIDSYNPDGTEVTGFDILLWLDKHPEFRPKSIQIVTGRMEKVAAMEAAVNALAGVRLVKRLRP